MSSSAFNLDRFLKAQAPVYAQVVRELIAARKASHWMWFVFPQRKGLGRTGTAQFYGIESMAEALAYWQHPVSGRASRNALSSCWLLPAGLLPTTLLVRPTP